MSWEIVLFGDLDFPPGGMDAWKQARVDPRLYRDWPAPFASDDDADEVAWKVGTWLDEYAAWSDTAPLHSMDVTAGPTRLELRGYLEKSKFADWARELATLFRLAERFGGEGSLTLLGGSTALPGMGYRVDVGGGRSRMTRLSQGAELEIRGSPLFKAIERAASEKLERRRLPEPPPGGRGLAAAERRAPTKATPQKKRSARATGRKAAAGEQAAQPPKAGTERAATKKAPPEKPPAKAKKTAAKAKKTAVKRSAERGRGA